MRQSASIGRFGGVSQKSNFMQKQRMKHFYEPNDYVQINYE